MNGFRKIFPSFLSHYATFFAKMAEIKVVPFDEFYYQLKLMHLFQKHLYFTLSFGNNLCLRNLVLLTDSNWCIIQNVNHFLVLQFFYTSIKFELNMTIIFK
jgi:hypothetical protein